VEGKRRMMLRKNFGSWRKAGILSGKTGVGKKGMDGEGDVPPGVRE